MNHAKTQQLLTVKDFGGCIFTINSTTAVQAQKKKSCKLSYGQKTLLVACVFYLVLMCTWFWLNVNRYTCFWHFP